MKSQKRKIYIIGAIIVGLTLLVLQSAKSRAATAIVQVQVASGTVNIVATGTLNLGSIVSSSLTGTISGQYAANSFYVSDLKGWTGGYTTTIQTTDLTGSYQGTTYTISGVYVYMKAGGNPVAMGGQTNPTVVLNVGITSGTYTSIGSVQTYFSKTATGLTGGILSTYGDAPRIKVDIPPYQTATSYQGTITFTLTAS